MIKTTNFDALAVATPLNREASKVRDGSGDLWEVTIQRPDEHWTAPPLALSPKPSDMEDLSGRVFGRMTVVRYHGVIGKHPRWLVRCACGDYELRRANPINSQKTPSDHCCQVCDRLKVILWKAKNRKRSRVGEVALLDRIASGERP